MSREELTEKEKKIIQHLQEIQKIMLEDAPWSGYLNMCLINGNIYANNSHYLGGEDDINPVNIAIYNEKSAEF